jgi:hypothetical protein
MPARPSDKGRMGVKTLGWWVVKAWDRDGRILFHDSLLSVDIIWKLTNFVALEQGIILMNLLREAAWEACSSNLEFGNHLSICLKIEENQENLCQHGFEDEALTHFI